MSGKFFEFKCKLCGYISGKGVKCQICYYPELDRIELTALEYDRKYGKRGEVEAVIEKILLKLNMKW